MAQYWAPPSEPANNAFFRLSVIGRIGRSTVLLSSSIWPSSMKRVRPSQRADGIGQLTLLADQTEFRSQPSLECVGERPAFLLSIETSLLGAPTTDVLLDGIELSVMLERLGGDRRLAEPREIEELAPAVRPACVRTSPGKEEECDLKPFIVTQRVRRPPGKGGARQPEASLAWVTATSLVKRRQRVPKPCG